MPNHPKTMATRERAQNVAAVIQRMIDSGLVIRYDNGFGKRFFVSGTYDYGDTVSISGYEEMVAYLYDEISGYGEDVTEENLNTHLSRLKVYRPVSFDFVAASEKQP